MTAEGKQRAMVWLIMLRYVVGFLVIGDNAHLQITAVNPPFSQTPDENNTLLATVNPDNIISFPNPADTVLMVDVAQVLIAYYQIVKKVVNRSRNTCDFSANTDISVVILDSCPMRTSVREARKYHWTVSIDINDERYCDAEADRRLGLLVVTSPPDIRGMTVNCTVQDPLDQTQDECDYYAAVIVLVLVIVVHILIFLSILLWICKRSRTNTRPVGKPVPKCRMSNLFGADSRYGSILGLRRTDSSKSVNNLRSDDGDSYGRHMKSPTGLMCPVCPSKIDGCAAPGSKNGVEASSAIKARPKSTGVEWRQYKKSNPRIVVSMDCEAV